MVAALHGARCLNTTSAESESYVDPALVRGALSLLDDLPFPALWIRRDHQVLWANAAAQRHQHAVSGACYSVCFGYKSPCDLNGASCPKQLAEKTGHAASVAHARAAAASASPGAEEVSRIFAVPLSAGGVLELHIPVHSEPAKDPVTGCLGRRAFEQMASAMFASAKATGKSCALITVDVAELDLLVRSQGSKAREANLKRIAGLVEVLLGAHAATGQWLSSQYVSIGTIERPIHLEHLTDSLKSSLASESFGTHRAAALIHIGLWQGSPDRPFLDILHETEQSMGRVLDSRKTAR